MTDKELKRQLRKLGKKRCVETRFDGGPGKGSHGRLYYGERWTTLTQRGRELGRGELPRLLKQLGLTIQDIQSLRSQPFPDDDVHRSAETQDHE